MRNHDAPIRSRLRHIPRALLSCTRTGLNGQVHTLGPAH